MGYRAKIIVIILSLAALIFAIKPYYGGEITLRLNEPADFVYTPSNYSNLVFYSLLYENLFYLRNNGEIYSNIFSYYKYDAQKKALFLDLKKNISFSNGDPISVQNVTFSLRQFLELKLENSIMLRRNIKNIKTGKNRITIDLMYHNPDIVSLLTAPELVLQSGTNGIFSGMFFPVEWEKNRFIKLAPNKFYPGGRTYLDSIKVIFYDFYYPDIFLSKPGMTADDFREFKAGIYQNIYLCFPGGRIGTNTRMAMYSLLKEFAQSMEMTPLNVLTSDDESPITMNIKRLSGRRVLSILRRSRIKLYVLSSLKDIEEKLDEFLAKKRLRVETIFLSDNELSNYMNNTRIDYLLMVKVFNKRMPTAEKVKKILKEMSFNRFNEAYLKLLSELEEVKFLKNEELLIEHISRIIEKIVRDGFLLPLYQDRYSLYVRDQVKGIELDYYGRPLFQKIRTTRPVIKQEKSRTEADVQPEVKEDKEQVIEN